MKPTVVAKANFVITLNLCAESSLFGLVLCVLDASYLAFDMAPGLMELSEVCLF